MSEGYDISVTPGVLSIILDGHRGGGLVQEDTHGMPSPGEAGMND